MVVGWVTTIFRQTKYFGRPSAVYVAKDRVTRTPLKTLLLRRILQVTLLLSVTYLHSAGNILTDENEIFSRWREYFQELLNSVKASTCDTHEVTHLGEDEVFTAAELATTIKRIKSGKAVGEDEIRPEMLKALTGEGILWLTRACQVAWKFDKTPRDWQTGVIIPIFKKGDRKYCNVQTTEGYHSLVCQGKYMPNALKGNAEK